jgi:two-component system response regulator YesN
MGWPLKTSFATIPSASKRKENPIKQGPISVVVIDDNPRSLEFVATALTRPGIQILTASKPEEGVALISRHRPEIVVTDLVMTGMTGLDVLQWTKKFDPEIDVIVMSAAEFDGSPRTLFEYGAADYLQKPISLSVLRERVGSIIQNHIREHQLIEAPQTQPIAPI